MKRLIEQDPNLRTVALRTPTGFLAFGLGSGLSRFAPGTLGTLAAVPFAVALKLLPAPIFWVALAILFLAGVYICSVASSRLGQHDPGGIVWDEMVGYWLTVSLLPLQWPWLLSAFVLFRIFDILKPWPIRLVEKKFGGGLGIMLDDIVAAGYAMAVLELVKICL